ncbi:MAG TPA: SPW repeat protein [Oscillatoriaceae cyanobacterium]
MAQGKWTALIALVAGLWVAVAALPWGFSTNQAAVWNDLIVGLAVAILGLARIFDARVWTSIAILVLGFWLAIAPMVLGYSLNYGAFINSLLFGVLIAFLGFWSALVVDNPRLPHLPTVFASAEPTEEERERPY